ncbi:MAG: HD-GYP domain-containing protein [Moorellales bacterium]
MSFDPESVLRLLRKGPAGLLSHSLAASRLAQKILAYLPAGERDLRPARVTLAALAHDLGKVYWPEEMFVKPAYLVTNADRALIRAHPIAGANVLREVWPDAPEEVVRAVLEHHERPGGGGYPYGTEPSPLALVVAAADVLSAMTEDRPYRPALPAWEAAAEVARWAPPELARATEAVALGLKVDRIAEDGRKGGAGAPSNLAGKGLICPQERRNEAG